MRISDRSSDVCASDLHDHIGLIAAIIEHHQDVAAAHVEQAVEALDRKYVLGGYPRPKLRQVGRQHTRDVAAEPAADDGDISLGGHDEVDRAFIDRKSTRLNSSH